MRSYASIYLFCVVTITSSGIGVGASAFQLFFFNQSRKYCLSKLFWDLPTSYSSAGQNLLESGVKTSSPITKLLFSSNPNSNFVSAIMIPLVKA